MAKREIKRGHWDVEGRASLDEVSKQLAQKLFDDLKVKLEQRLADPFYSLPSDEKPFFYLQSFHIHTFPKNLLVDLPFQPWQEWSRVSIDLGSKAMEEKNNNRYDDDDLLGKWGNLHIVSKLNDRKYFQSWLNDLGARVSVHLNWLLNCYLEKEPDLGTKITFIPYPLENTSLSSSSFLKSTPGLCCDVWVKEYEKDGTPKKSRWFFGLL